jgi:hypothetical protein
MKYIVTIVSHHIRIDLMVTIFPKITVMASWPVGSYKYSTNWSIVVLLPNLKAKATHLEVTKSLCLVRNLRVRIFLFSSIISA